jgi:SOS response regulatory protein OraA/RecX
MVATAVGEMKDTEVARARDVLLRKFGESAVGQSADQVKDHDTLAKQIRYMQTRGFSYDVIKRAMRPAEES